MAEKLIRDRIPEIAAARGDVLAVRVASDDEVPGLLEGKLAEEVVELRAAESREKKIDELVDVLTVVFAISEKLEVDSVTLSFLMIEKARARGWFDKKLVLRMPEVKQ